MSIVANDVQCNEPIKLRFYGTKPFCYEYGVVSMGSCPDHDDGTDAEGNRHRSKHGTDSVVFGDT